jgi:hypothetical protein
LQADEGNTTIKALTTYAKKHPRYVSVVCAVTVYGLLGFFLAPYLLEKNLVETMQQEFDAELRVEKIEINPFVLSLRINGLELDNPEGEPTVRIQEIFTNFQLSSLFRLALTFDEVRLSSAELFITRDKSGNMDFAYLMPSTDAQAEENAAPADEDSSLPQALIYDFTIEDWFINWSDQLPVGALKTRIWPDQYRYQGTQHATQSGGETNRRHRHGEHRNIELDRRPAIKSAAIFRSCFA